uniref:Uncharacterized protein n=1 Tax=Anguilla anguilla TaxID=7936 RepID=A0A0E9WNE5_ANGAN
MRSHYFSFGEHHSTFKHFEILKGAILMHYHCGLVAHH